MMLICLSCSITSCCQQANKPADVIVERIGSGHIHLDGDVLFVEIDATRYASDEIYTGKIKDEEMETINPVDGMLITCFSLSSADEVLFVIGDRNQEYLEKHFKGYRPQSNSDIHP